MIAALLYLFLILFYAGLYVGIAGHDFYAPDVRYEKAFAEDRSKLAKSIEDEINKGISTTDVPIFKVGEKELQVQMVRVVDVAAINEVHATIRILIKMTEKAPEALKEAQQPKAVSSDEWVYALNLKVAGDDNGVDRQKEFVYRYLELDEPPNYVIVWRLYENLFNQGQGYNPVLRFSQDGNTRLKNYLKGATGDAAAVGHQYLHMVYFSAVVITTRWALGTSFLRLRQPGS